MKFIKDKIYRWHNGSDILLIKAACDVDYNVNGTVSYNAHLWLTWNKGAFHQTSTNDPIPCKDLVDDVTFEENAYMYYCITNNVKNLTLEQYRKLIKSNENYEIY